MEERGSQEDRKKNAKAKKSFGEGKAQASSSGSGPSLEPKDTIKRVITT